jgi:hypothetical protein
MVQARSSYTCVIVAVFVRPLFGYVFTFSTDFIVLLVAGIGYALTNQVDLNAAKAALFGMIILVKSLHAS